ncbi:MAG: hypothetical protein ABI823_05160 [Bryobacteraceae bacterium]
MRLAVLMFCAVMSAAGAEIHIQFPAIKRILAAQEFTQDGRKYVRGDAKKRCNFAFLENPQLAGVDGKLQIRAKFSGRSAVDVLGRCVGVGDSFDLTILAVPTFRDGRMGLKDVAVSSNGRDGLYIRRVCAAIRVSMARDFEYPLVAEAKKILEAKRDPLFDQVLRKFTVNGIWISTEAVVISYDLVLVIK